MLHTTHFCTCIDQLWLMNFSTNLVVIQVKSHSNKFNLWLITRTPQCIERSPVSNYENFAKIEHKICVHSQHINIRRHFI